MRHLALVLFGMLVAASSLAGTKTHRVRMAGDADNTPTIHTWSSGGVAFASVTADRPSNCCFKCTSVTASFNPSTLDCNGSAGWCQTCETVCPCWEDPSHGFERIIFQASVTSAPSVSSSTSGGTFKVLVSAPSGTCWDCTDDGDSMNATTYSCDGDDGACYSCITATSNCPS